MPRRTRPLLALLVGLITIGGALRAGAEPPVRPAPKKSSDASVAADAALAALRANDAKALEAVSRGMTDVWAVATVLLERGEAGAAKALATAAPRPDTDALAAYVARYAVRSDAALLRGAIDFAAELLKEKRWGEALAQYDALLPDVGALPRIQVLHGRALALEGEKKLAEAAEAYSLAAGEAEALGWLRRASGLHQRAGLNWRTVGERERGYAALSKAVDLAERRQVPKDLGIMLSGLGAICAERGDAARALTLFERGIPFAEQAGDGETLSLLLGNEGTALLALGRTRDALAAYEKAVKVARDAEDRVRLARALRLRGIAQRDLGDAAAAASDLKASVELYDQAGDRARATDSRLFLVGVARLLGDVPGAKEAADRALHDAEELKDEALLARAWTCVAGVLFQEGSMAKARELLERAREVEERRGMKDELIDTLHNLGGVLLLLHDLPAALEVREVELRHARKRGDPRQIAITLDGLASVRSTMGEPERALELAEESRLLFEKTEDALGVAGAWDRIARAKLELGQQAEAMALFERARAGFASRGGLFRAAEAESAIGGVREARGEWALAIAAHERALALLEKSGDRVYAARELQRLGQAWHDRGDLGRALKYYEAAEGVLSTGPEWSRHGMSLSALASIWAYLGEPARSLALRERAVAAFGKAGAKTDVAEEMGAIALARADEGDVAGAVEEAERSLAVLLAEGDGEQQAAALGRLGTIEALAGRLPEAIVTLRRSLTLLEPQKDPVALGRTHLMIADVHRRAGSPRDALASATLARDLFARAGRLDRQFLAESGRTADLEALARHRDSIEAAHASIGLLQGALQGLGDQELSVGWSRRASRPFAVGLSAAAALGDVTEATSFLESARGHALLEMFAVRDTLRDVVLPASIRAAEIEARSRQFAAAEALGRATRRGDADGYDQARAAFDRAAAELVDVQTRAEREAKGASAVARPVPASLEAIRKGLREGEALVLYGSTSAQFVAVVVEASGGRIVPLGPKDEIFEACERLKPDDPGLDPAFAVAALRRLVVEPLALGASVKRLIVSPDAALAFVPFALLEREREVVHVPSATVLELLRAEGSTRGEGVLALGDPTYRAATGDVGAALLRGGGLFLPLPGSREEAKEVGTKVLLGEGATAAALRAALVQRRWRSVHFACHGVLDAECPALSGLALTPGVEDDGVLRVLDVFRLKVSADLVVLSACETARGKAVRGEGILGLTRAFLFAGAPRVIASLWKVDDAATRALMSKFYARWAEGASPAAALRDAQGYVGSRPAWKHPRFWAAWTLWGLPN